MSKPALSDQKPNLVVRRTAAQPSAAMPATSAPDTPATRSLGSRRNGAAGGRSSGATGGMLAGPRAMALSARPRSSGRRRVLDAALGPQRVQSALDLERRALAHVVI